MSEELATVRAEIKGWERNFQAEHGVKPSHQNIKDNPEIAAKYKLYKQLSKSSAPDTSSSLPKNNITTRNGTESSLHHAKPRIVEPTQPLSGYNPFSPQKKDRKKPEKAKTVEDFPSNPFTSPKKKKIRRSPSPDPFTAPPGSNPPPSFLVPGPSTPISRAQKRLRGEPVSPSPVRTKRQRVDAGPSVFQTSIRQMSEAGDDDEEEAHHSSFIDESPVKLGIRSLGLLFDDISEPAIPSPQFPGLRSSKEQGTRDGATSHPSFSALQSKLRPPSPPPPETAVSRPNVPGKARKPPRKSAESKVQENDDEMDTDSSDMENIKIVRRPRPSSLPAGDVDPDLIPEFFRHRADRRKPDHLTNDDDQLSRPTTPDLPEELRHVLALSSSQSHTQEENIVAGLVYGRREIQYDPIRGGEIWDVGEEIQGEARTSDEDDWEGEPIPWEVGEL